jgi:molybdate transport system substrate-binding protein
VDAATSTNIARSGVGIGIRAGALLVTGNAEFGALFVNELMAVRGVEVVGPLPPELQSYTVLTTGVSSGSKNAAAAKALIKFLSSPVAGAVYKAKGQEPG